MTACWHGRLDIVHLLLCFNADVNARDEVILFPHHTYHYHGDIYCLYNVYSVAIDTSSRVLDIERDCDTPSDKYCMGYHHSIVFGSKPFPLHKVLVACF